ncbi:MAG: 2-C-methyl-D-erythritol 4-phosphate cytidylyltransferase, partial [Chloroflexota bacterium]|nr:2-C-methyl-D-erythritol 4-phosphate cytidylyltransferase [Chloroflexota bacterium]
MAPLAGVLVAAGSSRRMGRDKLWIEIGGRPVWRWALDALLGAADVDLVAVVIPAGSQAAFRAAVPASTRCVFVSGGAVRADSVLAGLDALAARRVAEETTVLVHDAARPAVTTGLIERVADAATTSGAAVPVVPLRDALWRLAIHARGSSLAEPLGRQGAVAAQTPQAGRLGELR